MASLIQRALSLNPRPLSIGRSKMKWTLRVFCSTLLLLALCDASEKGIPRRAMFRNTPSRGAASNRTRQSPNMQQRSEVLAHTSTGSNPGDLTESAHVANQRQNTEGDQSHATQLTGAGPNRRLMPNRRRIPEQRTPVNRVPTSQEADSQSEPAARAPPPQAAPMSPARPPASGAVGSLNVLASFAGKNRVLVITAPHDSDGYYRLMMSLLKPEVYCEMAERHMHQVVLFHQEGEAGGRVRRVSAQGQVTEEPLDAAVVPRLMSFLKLEQGKFSMVLLRKNLQVEERYPYPVRLEAMYEVMDQTPVRRMEKARQKGFVQRCKAAGLEGTVKDDQKMLERPPQGGGATSLSTTRPTTTTTTTPATTTTTPATTTTTTTTPATTTTTPATTTTTTTTRSTPTTTTTRRPARFRTRSTTTTTTTTTTPPTTSAITTATTTTTRRAFIKRRRTTTTTKAPTTTKPTTTTTTTKPTTTTTTKPRARTTTSTTTKPRTKPTTTTTKPTTTTTSTPSTTIMASTATPEVATSTPALTATAVSESLGARDRSDAGRREKERQAVVRQQKRPVQEVPADPVDRSDEAEENEGGRPTGTGSADPGKKGRKAVGPAGETEDAGAKRATKPSRKNKAEKKKRKMTKEEVPPPPHVRKSGKKGVLFQENHDGDGPSGKLPKVAGPLTAFFGSFEKRRRLLVITTPSEENRMYTQQRDEYLENVCEMAVRKLSIVTIFGSWSNGTMKIDHYQLEQDQSLKGIPQDDLTNQELIRALRKELGLTFNEFYMVLTDYDMRAKQDYEVPIAMKAILDYIDTFSSRIPEMEKQQKQGVTCEKEDKSRSLENFLSRFRWRRRIFIISTPDDEEWAYQQQLYSLTSQACNLGLRHMSVLKLAGKEVELMGGSLELYPINGSSSVEREELSAALVGDIRNYFQVSAEYFSMLLVGKDGNVKSWYPSPMWSMSTIYDLVDSMQLRRQEMAIQQSLGMRCPDDGYGDHGYHGHDPDGYAHRGYGY